VVNLIDSMMVNNWGIPVEKNKEKAFPTEILSHIYFTLYFLVATRQ
jgi:hypothetical protein